MDRRFLEHYNTELSHLRETAAEFARQFPKIAGRLQLDREAKEVCPDPFVERLLEGFAFLTARVQVKMDAEFGRFTQALLETVYPHYLCPTPSMLVARFEPQPHGESLAAGYPIPRGTVLRTPLESGERTACEYRTAHELTLWPLRITDVRYFTRELAQFHLPTGLGARAVLQIRLQTSPGVDWSALPLDRLPFFLRGADDLPDGLSEQIFAHATALAVVRPQGVPAPEQILPAARTLRRVGYEPEEALLPVVSRTFSGYRLLREYFAFRPRFQFFELTSLRGALRTVTGDTADLLLVFREQEPRLEPRVDAGSLALFCTPAINLFTKRLDRVPLTDQHAELQVIADRTRPFDFEIFELESVTGYGERSGEEQPFLPFYLARESTSPGGAVSAAAFYTVRREARQLTAKERQFGRVFSYVGTELFLSLVDAADAPHRGDLNQLGVRALCTNRHLPLLFAPGQGATDFNLEINAPVAAVRCVSGPTPPRPPLASGAVNWQLISHLSLNYLSLLEAPDGGGATGLREILRLYADPHDRQTQKLIEGLRKATAQPVLRRLDGPGPITFARGLEVTTEFDELAFEGVGVFVFGAVLAEFFRRYVSINSFTETVVRTEQRREIMRWKALPGRQPVF